MDGAERPDMKYRPAGGTSRRKPVTRQRVVNNPGMAWPVEGAQRAAVVSAAKSLLRVPGVVGVSWGAARRDGTWTDERCLCVHVERKYPPGRLRAAEHVDRIARGVLTDVIEVGRPRVQWLDVFDRACPPNDGSRSWSTPTLFARSADGSRVLGLLSGHGTLPRQGGQIVARYDGGADSVMVSDLQQESYMATLASGRFDGRADFAVADFGATRDVSLNEWHPSAGAHPPLRVADEAQPGTAVRHYSGVPSAGRGRILRGVVRHWPSPIELRVGDGAAWFEGVYTVTSDRGAYPFSIPGDSGSLVTDEEGRCVGTIVGGSGDVPGSVSYVLPIATLKASLTDYEEVFFQ